MFNHFSTFRSLSNISPGEHLSIIEMSSRDYKPPSARPAKLHLDQQWVSQKFQGVSNIEKNTLSSLVHGSCFVGSTRGVPSQHVIWDAKNGQSGNQLNCMPRPAAHFSFSPTIRYCVCLNITLISQKSSNHSVQITNKFSQII